MDILNNIGCFISSRWNEIWPVFLGAFFGAWAAFQFQKSWEKSKQLAYDLRSGKRAQFALMSQFQALILLRKQHLNDLKDDPERHIKLHPITSKLDVQKVDINSLLFILDTNDPNLLNEVMVSQHSYEIYAELIEYRNTFHSNFQQRLSQIGDSALDEGTNKILEDLTNNLYEIVEHSINLNQDASERLGDFLTNYIKFKTRIKKLFQKKKTLKYKEK